MEMSLQSSLNRFIHGDLSEEEKAKAFRRIDERLHKLASQVSLSLLGLGWEIVRKVFFTFFDGSTDKKESFDNYQPLIGINPFDSMLNIVAVIGLIRDDETSEDLMELVAQIALFVSDRIRLNTGPQYLVYDSLEQITLSLERRIGLAPSPMALLARERLALLIPSIIID